MYVKITVNWFKKSSKNHAIRLASGMLCKKSPIQGMGIFAPREYETGEDVYEMVCPYEGESCRTEDCRLTNHSKDPNMVLERRGESIWAVASRRIPCDEECTIDYRSVIPTLMRGKPIGAGKIVRRTPGLEVLVKDDLGLTLLDQLQAIESGLYR